MLLFGHHFIPSERFYHIDAIDAIDHTPPNTTVFLKFSESHLDIITHCHAQKIPYALEVASLQAVIYAEQLGAAWIVVEQELAKKAQKVADHYLFDGKILCRIDTNEKIETFAEEGIDGVIFDEAIIKVTT